MDKFVNTRENIKRTHIEHHTRGNNDDDDDNDKKEINM